MHPHSYEDGYYPPPTTYTVIGIAEDMETGSFTRSYNVSVLDTEEYISIAPQKLKTELLYDSETPLLGQQAETLKIGSQI